MQRAARGGGIDSNYWLPEWASLSLGGNSWPASIVGKRWAIGDNLIAQLWLSAAFDMHVGGLNPPRPDLPRLMYSVSGPGDCARGSTAELRLPYSGDLPLMLHRILH